MHPASTALMPGFSLSRRDLRVGEEQNALGVDPSPLATAWTAASIAGTAIGAYHGYKRNQSVGWAVGWAILGALFPVVVIPLAYAQGIDKRA